MFADRNIKWRSLANHMAHAVATGRWRGQIPTETQLMADHACSRTTVRRAIDELCHLRLLHRRAPHGTFVPPGARDRARTLLEDGPASAVDR